ncbi:MAG: NADH-quinone oxidoreductase subunit L [Streptosporangiales bacterium]|nr:NADH-quinone oxidoreductase subunit L [Streptosporangiales bacterium]
MLAGPRLPGGPASAAVTGTAAATALAAYLGLVSAARPETTEGTLTLIPTGGLEIAVALLLDGADLAVLVAFMVCCVALAVQVYSVAYLRGDRRYSSYAAFISLFTAAMLLVVLSGDLITLYVGWEVMGFCSYALIGHYWYDRATSGAAVKAFLMTRAGDVGFLFGIFVLGAAAGSFRITTVLAAVPEMPAGLLVTATLLLLLGVAGKSAQFPLQSWLPDAMAGPTPVSALIHAATMVAAGVYVVARLYPAFWFAPLSLDVLAIVAVISAVGAAVAAFVQEDLKRVLAYSTVSQLAIMAAGLAVGAYQASVFHLLTHGAFKALLFLGAGAVIHAVGSNLMAGMGGLRGRMPITFTGMTIGFAALAGLPPTSGFFSKDAIVEVAAHTAGGDGAPITIWVAWLVYGALLLTVVITAAYAARAWLRVFFGPPVPGHEAPPLMSGPVLVLAVPALVLGFAGLAIPALRPEPGSALITTVAALAGAGVIVHLWRRAPGDDPAALLSPAWWRPVLADDGRDYLDLLYGRAIVRPVLALARMVARADARGVDGAVVGAARGARGLGGLLRRTQAGNAQSYVTGVLAGAVVIVICVAVLS